LIHQIGSIFLSNAVSIRIAELAMGTMASEGASPARKMPTKTSRGIYRIYQTLTAIYTLPFYNLGRY
jgi:hypothetical protein